MWIVLVFGCFILHVHRHGRNCVFLSFGAFRAAEMIENLLIYDF